MTAFADMEQVSPIMRRHEYEVDGRKRWSLWFICPGCKEAHAFDERWHFNGDYQKPTFSPSFLTWLGANPEATREPYISGKRCHSYVCDGQIQFLGDCTHQLAGQTVPLPGWSDDRAFGDPT
jgi:hypothetical protein